MLFQLESEVQYTSGESATVLSRPATDIAFERQFGITIMSLFADLSPEARTDQQVALRWLASIKSEYTMFIAWHASRSQLPFDEWIETVKAVNWKFVKEVDPTRPVQPATSSALSLPPSTFPPGNSNSVSTRTL